MTTTNLFSLVFTITACVFFSLNATNAATPTKQTYASSLESAELVDIPAISKGDKKSLKGLLFSPAGAGPFPAIVALHGAGGIFPYQAWWARKIADMGVIVLFVDSYCTRGHLCVYSTDDSDKRRGKIMRQWDKVSIKQRMFDAIAGYTFLYQQQNIKKENIGLIGWSWGGSTALFTQKFAKRLNLPSEGFKATIVFYPNLVHLQKIRQWNRGENIEQPTLVLFGQNDVIEDEDSYVKFLDQKHSGPISVIAFEGAVRKFDEVGPHRVKSHPRFGKFPKGFHLESFQNSVKQVESFVDKHFVRSQ